MTTTDAQQQIAERLAIVAAYGARSQGRHESTIDAIKRELAADAGLLETVGALEEIDCGHRTADWNYYASVARSALAALKGET